ncbi:MAG TPA: MerR family transcriptional regulator [Phycisphaerae bacterium]|nr:MerR family transcriptional regulator [Phycisphaerae bacterium]HDZ44189.1 MerR family transcriptional regulator [Phycisphaerae bacterium]
MTLKNNKVVFTWMPNQPITVSWYAAGQTRRIAGVSQRQLDYWDEKGLVKPSIQSGTGKGSERRYSYADLIKLSVVKQLRQSGLSLQRIRKAVGILKKRKHDSDPLLTETLITDGQRVHRLTNDPATVEDVLSQGQLAFSVVAIGQVEAKVRRRIELYGGRRSASVG